MTKSWNHNPDVKKRQEFPRRSKTKLRRTIFRIRSVSDSPVSISSCSSATRSRSRLGARGSGRPGPGWVGPPPTGRVAGRRRRDSGARGAGAVLPETSNDSPKFLRVASERNKRPTQAQRARRRSSQGRAGGQQPGRPGGHTQTPPDDPLTTPAQCVNAHVAQTQPQHKRTSHNPSQ